MQSSLNPRSRAVRPLRSTPRTMQHIRAPAACASASPKPRADQRRPSLAFRQAHAHAAMQLTNKRRAGPTNATTHWQQSAHELASPLTNTPTRAATTFSSSASCRWSRHSLLRKSPQPLPLPKRPPRRLQPCCRHAPTKPRRPCRAPTASPPSTPEPCGA